MALTAVNCSPSVWRNDASLDEMNLVIEFEIGTLSSQGICKHDVLRVPFDRAIRARLLGKQADSEIRVCIEKILCILQRDITREITVAICAKTLVSLHKLCRFIVFEVTSGTTHLTQHRMRRGRDMFVSGMACPAGLVRYAAKQIGMAILAFGAGRRMGTVYRPGEPQTIIG